MDSVHSDSAGDVISERHRRRALAALLLLLPAPTLGTASALLLWPEAPLGKVVFVATKLWIAALPVVWRRLVDGQHVSWSPPRNGGFGVAALCGIGIGIVILGAYFAALKVNLIDAQVIARRVARTGLNQFDAYLAGAVYWITLNSLMEEYVWRWFVFRKFETFCRGGVAVVATSLAFTAHHIVALAAHFGGPTIVLGSLGVFIGGLTWSWLYLRYRSVWPCYLSHAIVDAAIFWIGYDLIFIRAG